MRCPVDETTLVISDKQGIEIDYCPQCRGVWLDRGELDKLVDRLGSGSERRSSSDEHRDDRRPEPENYRKDEVYDRPPQYRDDDDDRHHGKHKKKEGFLGDLFDF